MYLTTTAPASSGLPALVPGITGTSTTRIVRASASWSETGTRTGGPDRHRRNRRRCSEPLLAQLRRPSILPDPTRRPRRSRHRRPRRHSYGPVHAEGKRRHLKNDSHLILATKHKCRARYSARLSRQGSLSIKTATFVNIPCQQPFLKATNQPYTTPQ